jgi:hypothetical protein
MSTPPLTSSRELPPLILHPFADAGGPAKLIESSRANLMLRGVLPLGDTQVEDLERRMLDGRYCEIKMLFYVGKDVRRWIEQCIEFADGLRENKATPVQWQSFAAMLIHQTPEPVRAKLKKWGVADYAAIFSRGLGLTAIFAEAPERRILSDDFIRNYHRFADEAFRCAFNSQPAADLKDAGFNFELYASGEYAMMLEREWNPDGASQNG